MVELLGTIFSAGYTHIARAFACFRLMTVSNVSGRELYMEIPRIGIFSIHANLVIFPSAGKGEGNGGGR